MRKLMTVLFIVWAGLHCGTANVDGIVLLAPYNADKGESYYYKISHYAQVTESGHLPGDGGRYIELKPSQYSIEVTASIGGYSGEGHHEFKVNHEGDWDPQKPHYLKLEREFPAAATGATSATSKIPITFKDCRC